MDKWQISTKLHLVLRDNGHNLVAGLGEAGISNFGCLAHTLQLVVKDGVLARRSVEDLLSWCRKIVGHFKHSDVAWRALASILVFLYAGQYKTKPLAGILITCCLG